MSTAAVPDFSRAATVQIVVGEVPQMTCTTTARHQVHYMHHIHILMLRRLKTIWLSPWAVQVLIQLIAAFIVGLIHGSDWTLRQYPGNIVMAMACLGVLSTVTHIRTFSLDRLMMSRDMGGIVSTLAYFVAYNLTDMLWIIAMPLTFGPIYYLLTVPIMQFGYMLLSCIMVCWWASGMTYLVSTMPLPLPWLSILAVFVAVIFGAFINGLHPSINEVKDNTLAAAIMALSYNRWAMEALVIEASAHDQNLNMVLSIFARIGICGQDGQYGQDGQDGLRGLMMRIWHLVQEDEEVNIVQQECRKYETTAYLVLMGLGFAFRALALTIMMLQNSTIVQRVLWKMFHRVS